MATRSGKSGSKFGGKLGGELSAWYASRAPRERRLLAGALALGVAVLVYDGLFAPAWDGRRALRATLPTLDSEVAQLHAQAERVRALRGASAQRALTGAPLRDAIAASLAQAGFADARCTLIGESVQIDTKAASFAAWLAWLDDARTKLRVRVVDAHATSSVKTRNAAGFADLSATLQPPGGESASNP
jgi:general secretion pathway protein M